LPVFEPIVDIFIVGEGNDVWEAIAPCILALLVKSTVWNPLAGAAVPAAIVGAVVWAELEYNKPI
jgi:hypothetical protein